MPRQQNQEHFPGQGTVKHNPSFNAEEAAAGLRKAMKGIGTDEKAVIQILTSCDTEQRQTINKEFKTMYGKDLIDDLKSELGGNLENAVVALMKTHAQFDAWSLRQAMKGAGTDEAVLIEILASRDNEEINAIKAAYAADFHRDLEKDLVSETSGHFKRLLVSLVQGNRSNASADHAKAVAAAQALKAAGEGQWGTDESEFNRFIVTASPAQLKAICEEYRKISDYDLEYAVKKEMSGNLESGFLAVIQCARDPHKYFATKLRKSMEGSGTDDETLVRVVVSRAERDMVEVKKAYIDLFGKSLAHDIKGDCAGDFKKILLALIGEA